MTHAMISLGPDVASCKQLDVIIYPSDQHKKDVICPRCGQTGIEAMGGVLNYSYLEVLRWEWGLGF